MSQEHGERIRRQGRDVLATYLIRIVLFFVAGIVGMFAGGIVGGLIGVAVDSAYGPVPDQPGAVVTAYAWGLSLIGAFLGAIAAVVAMGVAIGRGKI